MNTSASATFRFPTPEFRVHPIPDASKLNSHAKIASCYVRCDDLPEELNNWMEVNPRVPKKTKKGLLQGPVVKAMRETLMGAPEKFAFKNSGIYLLVDKVAFERSEGGRGVVSITLTDPDYHGVVNGGHTFRVIREVAEDPDCPDPWNAYVRLHILEDVNPEMITELAEGLNRSMQVDNPSLANLQGRFDLIHQHMEAHFDGDPIAYHQGSLGEIDVEQVLAYMAMFDLNRFKDRKTHPNVLFGHPKEVLTTFLDDVENKKGVFTTIIMRLHEILVLSDRIQQEGAARMGKLKVNSSKKENRVGSPRHKDRPALFIPGETIGGYFPLGFLFPMLAAFRANVSKDAWAEGRFEWLVDPETLLAEVIDEMADIVKQEFKDNNRLPAEVGRKEAAYRGCYSVVTLELANRGVLQGQGAATA